jgi:hypothetical protein
MVGVLRAEASFVTMSTPLRRAIATTQLSLPRSIPRTAPVGAPSASCMWRQATIAKRAINPTLPRIALGACMVAESVTLDGSLNYPVSSCKGGVPFRGKIPKQKGTFPWSCILWSHGCMGGVFLRLLGCDKVLEA